MKPLRSLIATAAIALALATASTVRADGPPAAAPTGPVAGPVYAGPGYPGPGYPGKPGKDPHAMPATLGQYALDNCRPSAGLFFQNIHKKNLPVYQAAPWYNYWPYDGHFLMPAPIGGQFYGPPMTGNFPCNPYFPGPSLGMGYGTMPGGPPPLQQTGR